MSLNLTYKNVNKIFGEQSKNPVHALNDVSFTIEPGELFCLLGPSGCGKTTLLRSTAGLESISSGQILYGDKDMTLIPPFRRNIGMVFQSFALYPHMNIFENVAYGLRVRKTPDEEVRKRVTEVMELVGLTEELKRNPSPTGLSGGQQQRVAIARALVYDPDILLLDEPLANLDAKLRRYMRAEIRRIQKATNITTIFVTHDQEEAMAIGDRLAVLRKGVVEQIGSSNELYTKPNNAFVSNFIGKMNFFNARLTGEHQATIDTTSTRVDIKPQNVRLPLQTTINPGQAVLVGARPEQIEIQAQHSPGLIKGEVQIIQHLGQFVRYEVVIDQAISDVPMEIDMPYMLEGVREHDAVFVSVKEGLPFLFLPEVRN
ncbi:MAG: ABC transporter ATP-binding protein [Sphaerochaeta sp.]|jgi:ABC-type sugar transport system ATPase subunit|uniref:ABC transporter ATP-binding protein n=1 Tax=Sphaerochaeta sp. TaxID=1972642 RepID=UPI002FCB10BA